MSGKSCITNAVIDASGKILCIVTLYTTTLAVYNDTGCSLIVCILFYRSYPQCTSKYKKLLISKRRIGILKKLPKQGEDSESL